MFKRLETRIVEKPWGQRELPPPFGLLNAGSSARKEPIGEIWFEPPVGADELLVKYIFTSENLSVQVHPSDDQTLAAGLGRQGKEECWIVTEAVPGARLGIGFSGELDQNAIRQAALDGSIERLLTWHEVVPGDFFYIPANTVHAIGAGISLLEVQQNSDITYRLYDYGRPRELHLAQGLAVTIGQPYDLSRYHRRAVSESVMLVDGPNFCLAKICSLPAPSLFQRFDSHTLLIPLTGFYHFAGHGAIESGQCAIVDDLRAIDFDQHGTCLVVRPTAQALR